jgi:hypothetical protein
VITVIYTLLALYVLFPDMVDKIIEMSRVEMAKNPKLTDEMIEQAVTMTKKFFLPFALGGASIGTGVLGASGAAIGAGVAKKNPNPFENNAA